MTSKLDIMAFIGIVSLSGNAWQFVTEKNLKTVNTQLSNQLVATTGAEKLACSRRAQAYFSSLGFSESASTDNSIDNLQNHLNIKWNRCVMQVTSTHFVNEMRSTNIFLEDVDEHKDLGTFQKWAQGEGGSKMTECKLSPPEGPVTNCHSEEEWDRFAIETLSQ